ncbi:hypothetical protein M758_1G005900 [Ceratodon purpureus]|nr:hypothetical protein M758_1G005900 [Ceratodon purpureus]
MSWICSLKCMCSITSCKCVFVPCLDLVASHKCRELSSVFSRIS